MDISFNNDSEVVLIAEEVVVRRIVKEHMEERIKAIDNRILQLMTATVSAEWAELSATILNRKDLVYGQRIIDCDDALMMEEKQFDEYQKLCQESYKISGLQFDGYFSCPLAQARHELQVAEIRLVKLMEQHTGLSPYAYFSQDSLQRERLMDYLLSCCIKICNYPRIEETMTQMAFEKGIAKQHASAA